jgi:uncharacterized protein YegJ (DUF2314 family)
LAKSKVFMFDGADPEMQGAYEKARATFKYFWRELAWEARRIVPALDVACVKAPFSDGPYKPNENDPQAEHMWISDVDFDGKTVAGTLLNSPNWLTSVSAGDEVRIPLDGITDWMYVITGEVYGAFTVNLMRARMDKRERKEHDKAWGRNFGDPEQVRLVPDQPSGSVIGEHPMSENMAPELEKALKQNPSFLTDLDDRGWTMLHHMSLAGSLAAVKILVAHGADVNAETTNGMTPLRLARTLGWEKVVALLESKGAK